ncbi:MAG: Eco57I restriction-modification methylase domain-containing protein [Anaerolineae bacterium]
MLASFRQAGLEYLAYLSSGAAVSDEAVVRLKIVEPLLAALGYDLQADLDPEHRVQEGAIDILVRANGVPAMLWELKRTQETDLARHEEQLTRYVLAQGVAHAVLCNGREVRVYQRVGDRLRFAYAFPLTAFAPGAPPPTTDETRALSVFFDVFNKDAFQEIERFKQEIAATKTPPLVLTPDQPQNEAILIGDLKRDIRRLHRAVLLRFRSHRALHQSFLEEKARREAQAAGARERLWEWLQHFEERSKTAVDSEALTAYLEAFTAQWTGVEEGDFVAEALGRSGIAGHLVGANHINFKTRVRDFYRAFTEYRSWHAKQLVELRPTLLLMQDFDRWREEIGVMAEDPAAEFGLQTVYIFVTRLLLIRICEDKDLITQKISDGGYEYYLDFSERFFDNLADAHATLLDIAYKDTGYIYGHFFSRDIFDWYTWEEEAIVRLFWVLNRFDFAQVSADLIGHIYEQYVDELERKRKGQFYTPPQVVNYILDQVGYEGPGIVGKRLLDPACGSGRFLVEAARRLIPELKKQADLSPKELVNERLRNSLFGLDINRFACFLAEVNLLVQVLDLVEDNLTPIARFHIYPTNTLISRGREAEEPVGPGNGIVYEAEVVELVKRRGYSPAIGLDFRRGFDWVVGNPPYVRADSPGAGTLRSRIEASERYRTLYKKWDLYIPFIEFAVQMLAEGGWHGFIVSDAYQTEEYGSQSREKLLAETTIESLTFAPRVSFFEGAQVHNLIYAVRKGEPPKRHRAKRYKTVDSTLLPQAIKTLPALSQAKWGEQIFRPEFEGEEGLDFSGCLRLGEICYVGYGLAPVSHEDLDPIVDGERRKLFVTDDLLSDVQDQIHPKRFVQGKDIDRFQVVRSRWLEWNTARVPSQLRRKKFKELFENEKLIVARRPQQGSLKAIYDERGEFYCDATVICAVPAHELANVHNRTLDRRKVRASLLQAAQNSPHYNLAYLTASINCRWLSGYLFKTIGTGKVDFYPDDLKKYPIPPADAETQAEIARLVKEIMDAKADVQRWREQGHCIDEQGIVLNPRPFLDTWVIPHGDLINAHSFITRQIGGHPTTVSLEGQRLTFRKQPLSYFESDHPEVLAYLKLYIETNYDDLRARPVADLPRLIRIPKSPQAVRDFLERLESERAQMMLRWMVAAQHEALIEEWAFDLYDVDNVQQEKLGGKLYTFDNVPANVAFVSILDNEQDNPMRRLAFPKDGAWHYRAAKPLPHAVLLWMCDGSTVTTEWRTGHG